ncbi:MAG: class I SAM-dependent methyltransferase [Spirochaetota bacterium]|nr:class I SAM-dependent methyltransferase [Spirochaetota bacterium]
MNIVSLINRIIEKNKNGSAWELWQNKWDDNKVDRIWGEKLRNEDWEKDPTYKLIAEKCVKNGTNILDIGSGGGVQYRAIKEYADRISYTGLDITPRHIEFSRKMFPEARFELGDAANLPFNDKEFDVSIIRHVIEHHPKDKAEKILAESLRVSKNCVLILFFIPPIEMQEDIIIKRKKSGFFLNTYNRDFIINTIKMNVKNPKINQEMIFKTESSPALSDQELYIIKL